MGRLIELDKVEFLKVDGNIEFNHGVDCCINRLLKQPTVEAISKDQYKADMVAMLTEIQLEIEEIDSRAGYDGNGMPTFSTDYIRKKKVNELIQQKINSLEEAKDENEH